MNETIHLTIVGPKDIYYYGLVSAVTLPGDKGVFTVHPNSNLALETQFIPLQKGTIVYRTPEHTGHVEIMYGFANIGANKIVVSVH